jgi:dipeptidyl-peptidase 4
MRTHAVFLASCLFGCNSLRPVTWPALNQELLADSAATYNFRLGEPVPLAITPEGAVLFRRTASRGFAADLLELDTRTGKVRTLVIAGDLLGAADEALSDAEKARRERSRTATRGVVDIDLSSDGRTVMFALGGRFFLLDRVNGACQATDPGGDAYDPHLSPDAAKIAFVRDGDLWIASVGAPSRRLTLHPADVEYGVAEFVAQEELSRRRGFWWSPDSQSLVFQRSDSRAVETLYVSDPRHPDHPPVPFKYPRAGTTNVSMDLGIVPVAGGPPTWVRWDLGAFPYLARVSWPVRGALTLVVLNRAQSELALLAVDPFTGTTRTLLTEHDAAWVNVNDGSRVGIANPQGGPQLGAPVWLDDGSGFLWVTESRDDWTLERRAPDGSPVQVLTTPGFGLRALVGIDGSDAIVEASSDPPRQDIWRVPLDGRGTASRMTDGAGVSVATSAHGVTVITTALHRGGRRSEVFTAARKDALPSLAERPSIVPTTTIETVDIGGLCHYVAITRPRAFDANRKYPVLLKVYGGPGVMTVTDALDGYVMDQWYADAGFIVVRADGRGTPNRGRSWERAIAGNLIDVPLKDQVAALERVAARHREFDPTRVGVFGWSFGGYLAVMAVLLRPDVFAAAVAGAPVTDWTLYDTAYTERYMRTPAENRGGYEATSALRAAAQLSRPLLVIHGVTDDNVHFANTLALIESLYVAGKRAEVITLSATHMVPDPKLNFAREQVQVEFFRDHLGPR